MNLAGINSTRNNLRAGADAPRRQAGAKALVTATRERARTAAVACMV